MVMTWHDGRLVQKGFSGYNRAEEDPNGVSPDGNNGDTYDRSVNPAKSIAEQLIGNKFLSGEITREEAEMQLDLLAANIDL